VIASSPTVDISRLDTSLVEHVAPFAVDISRIDTGMFSQIASFVGTSRELLNLALTCKPFGWQQPTTGLEWSLAEEVAREVVCSGRNDIEGARITLSSYARSTTTWLSVLRESEDPLKFDTLLGDGINYTSDGRTSICRTQTGDSITINTGTAVARNYIMESGTHYAEFEITAGIPYIGIVRPLPNLDPDRFSNEKYTSFVREMYGDFSSTINKWGTGNVHLCQYYSKDGSKLWTDWERDIWDEMSDSDWEGMEGCSTGDTIGMLLNLHKGTLSVYVNNRRLGVMKDGLSGSYCWYATLTKGTSVTIKDDKALKARDGV